MKRRAERSETPSLLGLLLALVLLALMAGTAALVYMACTIGAGLLRLAEILTYNGS